MYRGKSKYDELGAIICVAPLFEKIMKTKYAPKFPETDLNKDKAIQNSRNPLGNYYYLIALRNAKVSIGAKLHYQIESERRIIKPKRS